MVPNARTAVLRRAAGSSPDDLIIAGEPDRARRTAVVAHVDQVIPGSALGTVTARGGER